MKKIICLVLCFSLSSAQIQRPARAAVGGLCLGITILVAVGGGYLLIKSCQPRYRCITAYRGDKLSTNWCSQITIAQAEAKDWDASTNSFSSLSKCQGFCNPSTNRTAFLPPPRQGEEAEEIYVVEKSTDCKIWKECGILTEDEEGYMVWREPFSLSSRQAFYRVKTVLSADTPTEFLRNLKRN